MIDETRAAGALARALHDAGFEADSNVCAACGHHGGDHDLNNWCLKCPRPELAWAELQVPRSEAMTRAGWCYFTSHADRGWGVGVSVVLAHPFSDSDRASLVAALLDGHEAVLAGALRRHHDDFIEQPESFDSHESVARNIIAALREAGEGEGEA